MAEDQDNVGVPAPERAVGPCVGSVPAAPLRATPVPHAEPRIILGGGRAAGRMAFLNKLAAEGRGRTILILANGNHEVTEDIDHEIVP